MMSQADSTPAGQTPSGQQPTPDASPGQPQQQPQQQQQQAANPQAQREADLAALRRDHYGPREGMWFGAGPLMWWMKQAPAPGALASIGTAGPQGGQGIVGQNDTVVLFGNNRFDYERFFGFQVHAGTWLNCLHNWGVEFGGFYLEQRSIDTSFASDGGGNPLLARPFFNAVTSTPASVVIASPGTLAGSVSLHTDTQFWGNEANFIRNLTSCEDWNLDLLFGFRYLDLAENLRVGSTSQALPGGSLTLSRVITLNNLSVTDRFFTRDQFLGGQAGGRFERWFGPYFLSVVGKVALGPNHETIKTFGFSQGQVGPGQPNSGGIATQTGGLLAVPNLAVPNVNPPGTQPSLLRFGNIGRTTTDWFEVVPEIGVQFGMQVTDALRVSAGYNYLFMNSVARPGSQVNGNVNPALVPSSSVFGSTSGPSQPMVNSKQETFFAHGLVVNLEFRY
jgi:hypothetical protein